MEPLEEIQDREEGEIRLRRRAWWLFWLLIGAIAAVWLGKSWLFAEARCPRLQDVILYTTAGVATLIFLIWALITPNDAPIIKILSVFGLPILILLIASMGGAFFAPLPRLQLLYCPARACEQVKSIRSLREAGKLEAAEEMARDCLGMTPTAPGEEKCLRECAYELGLVLYEQADPGSLPPWEKDRELVCQQRRSMLEEAYTRAAQSEHLDLARSIQERQQRLDATCATPTPYIPPTPAIRVEIPRSLYTDREAFIDVRVLEGMQFMQGLHAEDFRLFSSGGPLQFEFEVRSSDDPVCLIVVADNSGSVRPGLRQLHAAIEKLNDTRKPSDELGLVTFGAHDQVAIQQWPDLIPLDTAGIDASGQFTALWDGALAGLEAAQSCKSPHRYLLLLTDGSDNDSREIRGDSLTQAREVARQAAQAGISICAVGVQSKDLKPEPLQVVAYGCGYFSAEDFDEVASLFVRIFGYLRDFYRLRLQPGSVPPNSILTLQVLNRAEVRVEFQSP